MKIAILQAHDVHETLVDTYGEYSEMLQALLAAAMPLVAVEKQATLAFTTFKVTRGQLPKKLDDFDAYIITGSKNSVYEDEPWIKHLIHLVQQLDRAKKKLIGICFGHQLIAHALGGKTEKSSKGWGIGIKAAKLNEQAINTKAYPLDREDFRLVYSHQDQVVIPANKARVLAGNDFCPIAMTSIGSRIFTFQGHPEFNRSYAKDLFALRESGYDPEVYAEALTSMELDKTSDELVIARWMLEFIAH